jgi:hypothetical protein
MTGALSLLVVGDGAAVAAGAPAAVSFIAVICS